MSQTNNPPAKRRVQQPIAPQWRSLIVYLPVLLLLLWFWQGFAIAPAVPAPPSAAASPGSDKAVSSTNRRSDAPSAPAVNEITVRTPLEKTIVLKAALEPDGGSWVERERSNYENDLYRLEFVRLPGEEPDQTAAFDLRIVRKDQSEFRVRSLVVSVEVDAARIQKIWPSSRLSHTYGGSTYTELDRAGGEARCHASSHDPVVMALGHDGENLCTMGMAWTVPETTMTWRFPPHRHNAEWDRKYTFAFTRPRLQELPIVTRDYHDGFYISRKPENWFQALRRYAQFVDGWRGYKPLAPSPWTLSPCWSLTWTLWARPEYWGTFKKGGMQTIIESQMATAKSLGFGTIHLDIDWTPCDGYFVPSKDRFSDFRAMMEKVRAEGMTLVAHLSAPVVSPDDPDFSRKKEFILATKREPNGVASLYRRTDFVFCPRTQGLRDHLVASVEHMVRDLGIKSFWVDFNDDMSPVEPCVAKHEHVASTIGEGWDAVMRELTVAARRLDPHVTFISRRSIANINNKKYLTHLCPADCEYDQAMQRRDAVFLRSFGEGTVPYAFHGFWAESEPDTEVARHMASQVFLMVPVVSQDFSRSPASHRAVIKAWLDFYKEHAADIVYGAMDPLVFMPPSAAFKIERNGKAFVGCFETLPATIPLREETETVYLFNGIAVDFFTRITGLSGDFTGQWLDHLLRPTGSPELLAAKNGQIVIQSRCKGTPCVLRLTKNGK